MIYKKNIYVIWKEIMDNKDSSQQYWIENERYKTFILGKRIKIATDYKPLIEKLQKKLSSELLTAINYNNLEWNLGASITQWNLLSIAPLEKAPEDET